MSDTGNSEFVWTPAYEVQLMFAMMDFKPVGINQHFNLARITEKFSAAVNRTIEPDTIWKHLGTWYDMDKLDDVEPLPFPNEEDDFELPEEEFGKMLEQARKNSSRSERFVESQRKFPGEARKENKVREIIKEDDGVNRNREKFDKRTPLRRVSKSDKPDSTGAEESKEKIIADKEKTVPGGRTRRSMKTDEQPKEESVESAAKKVDPSIIKTPLRKKEASSDDLKKKVVSEAVEPSKPDPNVKKPIVKTPSRNAAKEPEKASTPPKRVTRASVTPAEMESAKKKRRR